MPAKKTGRLHKILAVVCTTIVVPVLANVAVEETKDWGQALTRTLEEKLAGAAADWGGSALSPSAPPSSGASLQPPADAKPLDWRRATPAWGR